MALTLLQVLPAQGLTRVPCVRKPSWEGGLPPPSCTPPQFCSQGQAPRPPHLRGASGRGRLGRLQACALPASHELWCPHPKPGLSSESACSVAHLQLGVSTVNLDSWPQQWCGRIVTHTQHSPRRSSWQGEGDKWGLPRAVEETPSPGLNLPHIVRDWRLRAASRQLWGHKPARVAIPREAREWPAGWVGTQEWLLGLGPETSPRRGRWTVPGVPS